MTVYRLKSDGVIYPQITTEQYNLWANAIPRNPKADAYEPVELPTEPEQLVATAEQIAAYRWQIENGGVTVLIDGTPHRFDTTRENRAMWLAVQLQAMANPSFSQPWKTLDGVFIHLTAAQILTVCTAVYGHVAACFGREAQLAANPPTVADLPTAGWPS
jgi:hypothetical protein